MMKDARKGQHTITDSKASTAGFNVLAKDGQLSKFWIKFIPYEFNYICSVPYSLEILLELEERIWQEKEP
jgi:hypothetical protein